MLKPFSYEKALLPAAIFLGVFLGSCRSTPSVDLLLSGDPQTRKMAIQKLPKLSQAEKETTVTFLVKTIHDSDPLLALRATEALKHLNSTAAAALSVKINDKDAFVRACAIEVLATLAEKDPSLIPYLETAAQDSHPLVQEEALMALEKLRNTSKSAT
jgi:HEAT repeat protein